MKCGICERSCDIPEGGTGACGMYRNTGQVITELLPNKYLITTPISIETMPILHFYPGGKFLQISTVGCNFNCDGCISAVIVREMEPDSKALRTLSPEEVIKKAEENDCLGIAFLMNDPLASFPTFVEVAKIAKKRGLLVGCSSNTYFTEEALAQIAPYLDFINIGVKGLSAQAYRNCGGSTPEPVFRNMRYLHEQGIHLEISCIHYHDNCEEIFDLARRIANISPDIPLQIMRFIPLETAGPILEPAIRRTEKLRECLVKYLRHIYVFNSPGTKYLSTFCPNCGQVIYKRDFYGPMGAKLRPGGLGLAAGNSCPACGQTLIFQGRATENLYREGDFQGGYPFTRALEMIEAILIAIGVTDKQQVVRAWEDVLCHNGMQQLHQEVQNPAAYIGLVRRLGKLTPIAERAEKLADYMEEKLTGITEKLAAVNEKPRVYYAMGKPNFCINGGRMENQLVEAAGGISANKSLDGTGRPGIEIPYAKLQDLNPEVIFISSFLSSSVEDFCLECSEAGLNIEAVRNRRIYTHPGPCWDFGSPRWILGLMYIANVLHPEIFKFDLVTEAKNFYQEFYQLDFNAAACNRSFSKPNNTWGWSVSN